MCGSRNDVSAAGVASAAPSDPGAYWRYVSGTTSTAYANFTLGSGQIKVKHVCSGSGGGTAFYGPWVGKNTNSWSPMTCLNAGSSKSYITTL